MAGRSRIVVAMPLAAFHEVFSLEAWFDQWRVAIDRHESPSAEGAVWPPSTRRAVLEALSDASAEQFLNPLVASHLRRFGALHARLVAPERMFWVRSEWEKVDISYGLATPFRPGPRAWDNAWASGATGDIGQCEVKVCYTHLYAGKMKRLAGQLEVRRERDYVRKAPTLPHIRYHGLVWLFEHGGATTLQRVGDELLEEATSLGLVARRTFTYPSSPDDLGRLWPYPDGNSCGLTLALLELPAS